MTARVEWENIEKGLKHIHRFNTAVVNYNK
jgi:hypothetical protein